MSTCSACSSSSASEWSRLKLFSLTFEARIVRVLEHAVARLQPLALLADPELGQRSSNYPRAHVGTECTTGATEVSAACTKVYHAPSPLGGRMAHMTKSSSFNMAT